MSKIAALRHRLDERTQNPTVRRLLLVGSWVAVLALLALAMKRNLGDPLSASTPTFAMKPESAAQDFRDATYFPIKEFLNGGNPYEPAAMKARWPVNYEFDLYAPYHLWLGIPFALMPFKAGLTSFALLTILGFLVATIIAARAVKLPGGPLAMAVAFLAVMLTQFTRISLHFGQINALLVLGAVLLFVYAGRNTWLAALGMALLWVKPQFGIPILLLFIFRGLWRPVVYGTGIAILASLPVVGILVAREGGIGQFLAVVQRNVDYARNVSYTANTLDDGRLDMAAVLYRVTGGWTFPAAELIFFVLVMAIGFWLLRGHRTGKPLAAPEMLFIALATSVCIVHLSYDAMIILPGYLGLVAWLIRGHRLGALILAAMAVLLVPMLYYYNVYDWLIAHYGITAAMMVDGLSIEIAFFLMTAALIWHHRKHRDIQKPDSSQQKPALTA